MAEEWGDEDADKILDDLLAEDYLPLSPEPHGGHEEEEGEEERGEDGREEAGEQHSGNDGTGDSAIPIEATAEEPQPQAAALLSVATASVDVPTSPDKHKEGLGMAKQGPRDPLPAPPPEERPVRTRPRFIRYFILKSNTIANIDKSLEHGVWSTQPHNETKLNYAFQESDEVRLIFSVNQSGHFQGYARMVSSIRRGPKSNLWVGSAWGGLFEVEWQCRCDLSFYKVEHLANPLNEGKPVKIAKDGQEVHPDVGEQLVRMMEEVARQVGGNALGQGRHTPACWWPGQGYGQQADVGMDKVGQGGDRSRVWRSVHETSLGRNAQLATPPHEAGGESLQGRVRSRSDEGLLGRGSPKRVCRSLQGSPGRGGSRSPGKEGRGTQDGRSQGQESSQQEGGPPHVFDLTYGQYLDYYCKVQTRISELYSSGQLFGDGERGRQREFEGDGHFLRLDRAGIRPSSAGGRAGAGPMSEAQYVEYCANYFCRIGRPFNEEAVRRYYWRMRSQYDRQVLPRNGG